MLWKRSKGNNNKRRGATIHYVVLGAVEKGLVTGEISARAAAGAAAEVAVTSVATGGESRSGGGGNGIT